MPRRGAQPSSIGILTVFDGLSRALSDFFRSGLAIITLPIDLSRQECNLKRKELERVRDERAEALGELTNRRDDLAQALGSKRSDMVDILHVFMQDLNQLLIGRMDDATLIHPPPSLLNMLTTTSFRILPMHTTRHTEYLHSRSLIRPSRLALIWPRLFILPPLSLYAIQKIYNSKASLYALTQDAIVTVQGFWRGWLLDPIKEVLGTVRTGGAESVLVRQESVNADTQVRFGEEELCIISDALQWSLVIGTDGFGSS